MAWPKVIYSEEVIREGFGIEDVGIPVEARVELLDALSATGLKRFTIGAFVSPRFVPQMACFEELLRKFHPVEGVTYLPFIHNEKARKLAEQYSPPLTLEDEVFTLFLDICDVHQRRNVNRSIEQAMAHWPEAIFEAKSRGVREGRIGIASAWGSNFLGKFTQRYCLSFLERQYELMRAAGIAVAEIGLHDSQSWCLPHEMEQYLSAIRRRWPEVNASISTCTTPAAWRCPQSTRRCARSGRTTLCSSRGRLAGSVVGSTAGTGARREWRPPRI